MDDIDFVVTWVDGNDPVWRAEKNKYEKKNVGDLRDERYRDWDNLRYWFRAVEKFAPWVRMIHFVTYGHIPNWLNTNHSKLAIVKHEDFIPHQYLPTFSARPIEFFLHKIPDLTDHFVYFNDDMFLTAETQPDDFFKNGLPRDAAILNATSVRVKDIDGKIVTSQSLYITTLFNVIAVNRHFDKKKSIRKNLSKWFSPLYGKYLFRTLLLLPWSVFLGFYNLHLPYSYLKSTFDDVWEQENEALSIACNHKFREPMDVSGRLMALWQIAKGTFEPRNVKCGAYYRITGDTAKNQEMYNAIIKQKYKMICVNDECNNDSFERVKQELNLCFEKILPHKSEFEK